MRQIPVATYPSTESVVTLDGDLYTLLLQWNTREEAWQLSLGDRLKAPIVEGIKVVPNYDLLQGYRHLPGCPQGALYAVDVSDNTSRIGYLDFNNERSIQLTYVTEAERASISS